MRPTDRRELANTLHDRMAGSYEARARKDEHDAEDGLVKTYLLEADPSCFGASDDLPGYLGSCVKDSARPGITDLRSEATDDSRLLRLSGRCHGRVAEFHIDASHERYWLAHTMASSRVADAFLKQTVDRCRQIDRAWLDVSMLEWVAQQGQFSGLGLDFDRGPLLSRESAASARVDSMKMQVWGRSARDVMEVLRTTGEFGPETSLAKVKVRYGDADDASGFTIDEVKYNGKFTARGTSFMAHADLVHRVQRRYSRMIEHVERHGRLRVERVDRGWEFRGACITYQFTPSCAPFREWVGRMFSCALPFRLWGVPDFDGDDFARVAALDLHVGQPLDFEIAPDRIRLFMHEASCGNTVLRLLANLQRTLDAGTRADMNGESISGVQPQGAQPDHSNVPR